MAEQSVDTCFDDIIVGGGSAGCVLANRLSANPSNRVLLIEAGIDTPPGHDRAELRDSYPMALFFGNRYIWPGLSAKTSVAGGRQNSRAYEQGRVMGGGSSINVQAANRGLPRDYDDWAALGARGWGFDDVLPYFCKLETDLDFDGNQHGRNGPIPIRRILPGQWPPYAKAMADALDASGLPRRLDQNADFEDGIFPPAFSNQNDQRVSAADGYLDAETRLRSNLTIMDRSHVLKVHLSERRATGVTLRRLDGSHVMIGAGRVIMAAGALQSPAILMRSGIGNAVDLQSLGIDALIHRPGVGQNLRDHPALTFCQYLPKDLRLDPDFRRASLLCMRFSSGHAGGSSSDMYMSASARSGWHGLGQRLGLYFLWCNQPHSVGELKLRAADPDVYPDIDLRLLSDTRDLERLMLSVRRLASLVVTPAINPRAGDFFPAALSPRIKKYTTVSNFNRAVMAVLGQSLDVPAGLRQFLVSQFLLNGNDFSQTLSDDRALSEFVLKNVFGVWHPSGTCRMGDESDPLAVVDPDGKLIGSDNLYVADASVMPRLPTANTNIPTLMIAEKISDGLVSRR